MRSLRNTAPPRSSPGRDALATRRCFPAGQTSPHQQALLAAPPHPDPLARFRIELPRTAWIPEQAQPLGAIRSALGLERAVARNAVRCEDPGGRGARGGGVEAEDRARA